MATITGYEFCRVVTDRNGLNGEKVECMPWSREDDIRVPLTVIELATGEAARSVASDEA